ncbi:MAG TPA: hypothetical protein VL442_07240 [Mucilaginibacter sp.]|jgi:hypothetical protein|nr:hypothetical protein [Mucilaginibacter sp.]
MDLSNPPNAYNIQEVAVNDKTQLVPGFALAVVSIKTYTTRVRQLKGTGTIEIY